MHSSQRTAGWRIIEGAALARPGPSRLQWHQQLLLGWHHALLALRLFPLHSGCPETQQQPSPLPEELQQLGGQEGSPGSPLHQLLVDHSTWMKTCPVVWRRLAHRSGLEGLTNIFIAWRAGSSSATGADNPQRSRPAPGRCCEELAGMSAWC